MTDIQVDHTAVIANLQRRIADDAGTIALLQAALDQRTAELEQARSAAPTAP